MKQDLIVQPGVAIPAHELEITASRAGGPGGQHVNKTSSRITIRWNVAQTSGLDAAQKERVMRKLAHELTAEGDILVHAGSSRSQLHNKEDAYRQLAQKIRKALHVPKKRIKTKVPQGAQEKRLQTKSKRGEVKKMRRSKIDY